ncbi:MAG: GNAT family N-acetyltransferase [Burkholderiaceae bacterium]|nr:GNAT family N-acetyltransferase [Burkholderiaceae bacterium]
MHPLDRPVWASLNTHRAALSQGTALARRFQPDVNLFASAADNSEAALAALAALLQPGETVFVLQVPEIRLPPGLQLQKQARGVQMVASRPLRGEAAAAPPALPWQTLGDADAADMLQLARLTEPGPFQPRTHTTGIYLGLREQGRLMAMAGERLRLPGWCEISGVCTHPEARGRGLARQLSMAMAALIEARGEQPFLHAWRSNAAAIALYESLGFRIRCEVNVAVLTSACPATD